MKIYHAPRSRSLRVLWLCEEMGLAYETVPASFINPAPDFEKVNPAKTLPVLIDGPVVMTESVSILMYLAAKHGPTPLAVAPDDARYPDYLQYVVFGEASLSGPLNALLRTRFFGPEGEKSNFTTDKIAETYLLRRKMIERQLERGDYVAGDAFTLADISVTYALGLGHLLKLDEEPASIRAYIERTTGRPAYQRAMEVK